MEGSHRVLTLTRRHLRCPQYAVPGNVRSPGVWSRRPSEHRKVRRLPWLPKMPATLFKMDGWGGGWEGGGGGDVGMGEE